jgi:UDP-3-O-[3-hydroxymyristoyl] glucosamine N-acyltransferase
MNMKIDAKLISETIGNVNLQGKEFTTLGLVSSKVEKTLTFLDEVKFLHEVINNENIEGVITTSEISKEFIASGRSIELIISEDPRYDFFTLLNKMGKLSYVEIPSVISKTAQISSEAYISAHNVTIGERTIVGPNVTILPDVSIGDDCVIQPGTVIGSEGFEYKRTSKGVLPVFHDGKVIIGNGVEVGSNTCIDKGFSFRSTVIDDNVKIDNLVHVAHGVHIGRNSFIIASAMLGGSVTIGRDVWVSPNTSIAPGLSIGDNAFISLGAVVTKNVEANQQVTGNFAIPHDTFLKIFKSNLRSLSKD